jgi:hypothetical protein
MRVLQVLVDPVLGRRRQLRDVQLAGADLELLILPRDRVPVDVNVAERVIGAYRLLLLIDVPERQVIP